MLSLILWALTIIVTLKYVLLLLRADNKGEGGILSLMALAQKAMGKKFGVVFYMGMIGAALFYGDAAITPAISVLSAVEGLHIITPACDQFILPVSMGILFALFLIQKKGTGHVSAFFGPVTAVWFIAIALAGLVRIVAMPSILVVINPWYGIHLLLDHHAVALAILGAVFLAVTGGRWRRFMPISAISGARRSRAPGCFSCFPACCSIISGRGLSCWMIRKGLKIPSFL